MSLGVPASLIISNVKRAFTEFKKSMEDGHHLDSQGDLITNLELACTALCVGGEEFVREIKCSEWVQTCTAVLAATARGTHMEVECLAMRVLALIADTVPKGTFAITKKSQKTMPLLTSYLSEPEYLLQHEDFTEDLFRCLCFISASHRDPLIENNVLGLLVSLDPLIGEKHLRRLCLLTCGNLLRSARATEWPTLHQAITQLVENTFDFCTLVLRLNSQPLDNVEEDEDAVAASSPSTRYQAHVAAAAAKAPGVSVTEDEVVILNRYCRCLAFIADRLLISVHYLKKYSSIVDNLVRLSTTLILFSAKTKSKTCDMFRSAGCSILLSLYFTDPSHAMMLFIGSNIFDAVCSSMLDSLHSPKEAIQDATGEAEGEAGEDEDEDEGGQTGSTSMRPTAVENLTAARPTSRASRPGSHVGLRNPASPLGLESEGTGTDFSAAGHLAASQLQLGADTSLAFDSSDVASPNTGADTPTRHSEDAGSSGAAGEAGTGVAADASAPANPPPVVTAANEPQDGLAQQLLSDNITAVPLISDELSIIPLLEFLLVVLPIAKEPRAVTDSLSVTVPHFNWVWEDDFHNVNTCAESLSFRSEREYAHLRASGATWSTMFEIFHNGAKRPLIIDFANQLFINGSEMYPHAYAREPLLSGYRHLRLDGVQEGACDCCKKATDSKKAGKKHGAGTVEEDDYPVSNGEEEDAAEEEGHSALEANREASSTPELAQARGSARRADLPANLNDAISAGSAEGAGGPRLNQPQLEARTVSSNACCFCMSVRLVAPNNRKGKKGGKRGLANPNGALLSDRSIMQQTSLTDARVALLTSTTTRSVFLTEAALTPLLSVCSPALVAIVKNTVNPIVARHIAVLFLRIVSLSTEYCCGKDAYETFTVSDSTYDTGVARMTSGRARKSNLSSVFNRKANSSTRRIEEMMTKLAPSFFNALSYLYLTRTCEMKGYLSYAFPYKQLCDDANMRDTYQRMGIGKDFAAFYFNISAEMNLSAADALTLLIFLYNRTLQAPKEKKRGGASSSNRPFSDGGLALSAETLAQCPLASVLKKSQLEVLVKCTKDRLREISGLRRDGLYLEDLRLNEFTKVKKLTVRVGPTATCRYHMNIESAWQATESFYTGMDRLLVATLRKMQQALTALPSSPPSRQKNVKNNDASILEGDAELLLNYSDQPYETEAVQEEKPVWIGNEVLLDESGQERQRSRIQTHENVNPLTGKQRVDLLSPSKRTKPTGEELLLVATSRHTAWLNAIEQRVERMAKATGNGGCAVPALWPALALYDELRSSHTELRAVAEQCPEVLQRAALAMMQWAAPLLQMETYQEVLKDKDMYVRLNRQSDQTKGLAENPYLESINWSASLDEQIPAETRAKLTALLTDLTHTVDEQLGVAAADQLFPPLLINQSSNFEKRFSRNKATTSYEELMWTPMAIALEPYPTTTPGSRMADSPSGQFDIEVTPPAFDEDRLELTLKGRVFKCLPFPPSEVNTMHVLMSISTITVGWLRLVLLQHVRHGLKGDLPPPDNTPAAPGVKRTISSMFNTTRPAPAATPGNTESSAGRAAKSNGRGWNATGEEPVEVLHSTETVKPAKEGDGSPLLAGNKLHEIPRSDDQIVLLVDGVPLLSPHTTLLDALFYFSKTGHQLRQLCGAQMASASRVTADHQFTRFTSDIRQCHFWSSVHHIQFVILEEPLPLEFYEVNFGCGCRPLLEGTPATSNVAETAAAGNAASSSTGRRGSSPTQRDTIWPKCPHAVRGGEVVMGAHTPFYCSPAHIFTRTSPSGKTFHADATLQLLEALTLVTRTFQSPKTGSSSSSSGGGTNTKSTPSGGPSSALTAIGVANDQRRLSSSLVHDMFSQVPSFMLPCLMNVTMQKAMSGLLEGHLSSYAVWNYPHIFPLEMRVTLLEMFLSTRRRISTRILRILRTFNTNQIRSRFLGFSWLAEPGVPQTANPKRVSVTVDRKRILEGAEMLRRYGWCSLPLDLCFRDEPGIGLGPALEFLEELGKTLMLPSLGMWQTEEVPGSSPSEWVTSPFLYPAARQTLRTLHHFESVGLLLARLLLMRRTTNMRFHPLLLRRLLGQCITDEQSIRGNFCLVDSSLANALAQLESLSAEDLLATETYFVLPISEAPSSARAASSSSSKARRQLRAVEYPETAEGDIELFPGGATTRVTKANVYDYTNRVRRYYLYYLPDLVLSRVRIGLHTALNSLHLRLFSVVELDLLLSGPQGKLWATPADFAKDVVASHGYTRHSTVVQYLLELVPQWEKAEQRLFLRFITGSSAIPLSGRLSNPITVVRRDGGGGTNLTAVTSVSTSTPPPPSGLQRPPGLRASPPPPLQTTALSGTYAGGGSSSEIDSMLPTVSTCFNYLKLPCYSSKAVLERQLKRAIEEGQGAFMLT